MKILINEWGSLKTGLNCICMVPYLLESCNTHTLFYKIQRFLSKYHDRDSRTVGLSIHSLCPFILLKQDRTMLYLHLSSLAMLSSKHNSPLQFDLLIFLFLLIIPSLHFLSNWGWAKVLVCMCWSSSH